MNRSHVFVQIANFLTAHWTNHLKFKYFMINNTFIICKKQDETASCSLGIM